MSRLPGSRKTGRSNLLRQLVEAELRPDHLEEYDKVDAFHFRDRVLPKLEDTIHKNLHLGRRNSLKSWSSRVTPDQPDWTDSTYGWPTDSTGGPLPSTLAALVDKHLPPVESSTVLPPQQPLDTASLSSKLDDALADFLKFWEKRAIASVFLSDKTIQVGPNCQNLVQSFQSSSASAFAAPFDSLVRDRVTPAATRFAGHSEDVKAEIARILEKFLSKSKNAQALFEQTVLADLQDTFEFLCGQNEAWLAEANHVLEAMEAEGPLRSKAVLSQLEFFLGEAYPSFQWSSQSELFYPFYDEFARKYAEMLVDHGIGEGLSETEEGKVFLSTVQELAFVGRYGSFHSSVALLGREIIRLLSAQQVVPRTGLLGYVGKLKDSLLGTGQLAETETLNFDQHPLIRAIVSRVFFLNYHPAAIDRLIAGSSKWLLDHREFEASIRFFSSLRPVFGFNDEAARNTYFLNALIEAAQSLRFHLEKNSIPHDDADQQFNEFLDNTFSSRPEYILLKIHFANTSILPFHLHFKGLDSLQAPDLARLDDILSDPANAMAVKAIDAAYGKLCAREGSNLGPNASAAEKFVAVNTDLGKVIQSIKEGGWKSRDKYFERSKRSVDFKVKDWWRFARVIV